MALFDLFSKKKPEIESIQQPVSKILVVDDELYLREFYEELLIHEGYNVITAQNGQEALDLTAKEHPDLIILDIMMPLKDGNEVLRELSENEQTNKIPVIVLTNVGNLDNMDNAKNFSAFRFFIKSNISPEEIIIAVKEALDRPAGIK